MDFFEHIRRANADWYTAHPLAQLSDDDLARLAAEAGLTVEELRAQMTTPSVEMTCPLCGQPSIHLVNCRGCGGDAFGGEWIRAHGEDMHQQLQVAFTAALSHTETLANLGENLPHPTIEQITYAARHAYSWGGCLICSECWAHTLPTEAYQTCPLKLLADRTLTPEQPPSGLFFAVLNAESGEARIEAVRAWVKAGWQRWIETWNTVADKQIRQQIALWRHLLWEASWR